MNILKFPLLISLLFVSMVATASACENHLRIVNNSNEFIKMHEGMFDETESIMKPGEIFDRCFFWGVNGLSIKSIDVETMSLVRAASCPQHLTVNGKVDVIINNSANSDRHSCEVTVVEIERPNRSAK